ncbi:MAG: envelope stress response membrane protein PspC [Vibrionaceae bacterium]
MSFNKLYRDPKNGRIGGVCAGLAAHFGIDVWIMRALAICAFFIGFGFTAVIVYVAAMLFLDAKPQGANSAESAGFAERERTRNMNAQSTTELLAELKGSMKSMEKKIEQMEAHVTSREFELKRKFDQL